MLAALITTLLGSLPSADAVCLQRVRSRLERMRKLENLSAALW